MKILNRLMIALVLVVLMSSISLSADFPNKPIIMINPWSAGGGTDVMARTLAEELKSI